MPKTTFENLSQNRQQEIIDVAMEEFALYDYGGASLSRIIKRLGLAKGSFYRYFDSKAALYKYLLNHATQMRMQNVQDLFANTDQDFFDLIIENFRMKLLFDLKYPIISGFLYNVSQERQHEELGNIRQTFMRQIMRVIRGLMGKYNGKANIRTDIHSDILAFCILQIQMGIYDYLALKYEINVLENIKHKKPIIAIPEEEVVKIVRDFTEVLRRGMMIE